LFIAIVLDLLLRSVVAPVYLMLAVVLGSPARWARPCSRFRASATGPA
jgi:uncharacterized membrane protein YdfJ with MMPL/SSD domain